MSLLFFFMVFVLALNVTSVQAQDSNEVAEQGTQPSSGCGDQYDHTIAVNFGKEYQKALKARDYVRLKELKAQKDQTDLWAKTSKECLQNDGGDAESDVDIVQDEESDTESDVDIVEEDAQVCRVAPSALPAVFTPTSLVTQTIGDCKVASCSNGNLIERPDDADVGGSCKVCSSGISSTAEDGFGCDDGLFCTSADGVSPGPDNCTGGNCNGLAIGDIESGWSQAASFDFGEAESFIAKVRNVGKVIDTLQGHIGQGSGGTGIGGESTGSWVPTVEYSVRDVTHCCEALDNISTGTEHKGTISASPLKRTWESPGFPIPVLPAVKIGLDIEVAGGVSGSISGIDSECDDKVCDRPDLSLSLEATVGGGPYLALFHPKLLKLAGTVSGKASATATFECLKAPTALPQLCFNEVALTGRVILFGGLNYDIGHQWPVNACL